MNIFEWNKTKQSFVEVNDLTFMEDAASDEDGIRKAGYCQEISSYEHAGDGAGIRVYSAGKEGHPEYFISIAGMNSRMASLVARDFPSLIETLKQLHPLLTLIGLDQFNFARVADEVDRELAKRKE